MCPPIGFRLVASIASLKKWRLTKIDVKTAFLQTGNAERDVYVISPIESADRGKCLWLLMTAAYGLVNSNAKWQVMSDQLLIDIGFSTLPPIPQLFLFYGASGITSMLSKIVDDFLICGIPEHVDKVITKIQERFTLGTISHGPGLLRYYGLNIVQYDDFSVSIDADDKLNAVAATPITRVLRRELGSRLNPAESTAFASIKSSINWLGITSSPFCSLFSSMFQQLAPTATISDLLKQATRLKELKNLQTLTLYSRPTKKHNYQPRIFLFCDAGRHDESGQICVLGGLLLGPMALGSIFHVISWCTHKARRPVKSIAAAETFAAGEAIDFGKVLVSAYQAIFNIKVNLVIAVDSKDLYTSLSTQRQSIDKSIRGDVGVVRYEFETKTVSEFVWIPGKLNLADVGTKFDSPLTQPVKMMLQTSTLPFDFDKAESRTSDRSLG